MASSRKRRALSGLARRSEDRRRASPAASIRWCLLHQLQRQRRAAGSRAIHVHHGLSPNADAWAALLPCASAGGSACRSGRAASSVAEGEGRASKRRRARRATTRSRKRRATVIALAHNLDDQAETVLHEPAARRGLARRERHACTSRAIGGKTSAGGRCSTCRARRSSPTRAQHALDWIEDESNADEALTRNFIAPPRRRRSSRRDIPAGRQSLRARRRGISRARRRRRARTLLRELSCKREGPARAERGEAGEMLKQLSRRRARAR